MVTAQHNGLIQFLKIQQSWVVLQDILTYNSTLLLNHSNNDIDMYIAKRVSMRFKAFESMTCMPDIDKCNTNQCMHTKRVVHFYTIDFFQ